MAEGLGAGGVEECKEFPPPTVPKTNAASPRVPLDFLVSNARTAARSRRTLTEDLGSAEAIRPVEMVKRARLTKDVQGGGSFLQHLDAICSSGEHVVLYMEGAVVHSRYFLAASLFVLSLQLSMFRCYWISQPLHHLNNCELGDNIMLTRLRQRWQLCKLGARQCGDKQVFLRSDIENKTISSKFTGAFGCCITFQHLLVCFWSLKKNLNASRPSEHSPVRWKTCQNL